MDAMSELRKAYPAMRRVGPVAIVHSGGAQTVLGCVCGATHTYATKWGVPKHATAWRAEHNDCAATLVASGR